MVHVCSKARTARENFTDDDYIELRKRILKKSKIIDGKLVEGVSCREWQQGCGSFRYGSLHYKKVQHRAHIISYECYYRKSVPEKMQVMHKCHNKKCVEPLHLKVGTNSENARDNKNNPLVPDCKLDNDDVNYIREFFQENPYATSITQLANEFNVGCGHIHQIVLNGRWIDTNSTNLTVQRKRPPSISMISEMLIEFFKTGEVINENFVREWSLRLGLLTHSVKDILTGRRRTKLFNEIRNKYIETNSFDGIDLGESRQGGRRKLSTEDVHNILNKAIESHKTKNSFIKEMLLEYPTMGFSGMRKIVYGERWKDVYLQYFPVTPKA